jgi:photosystem II stability/assembly factor-like uncharacterized protein
VTVPGTVTALEASGGFVQAAVFDGNGYIRIETSPVSSDAWRQASVKVPDGAGPVPHTQLVLQGSAGWLVQVDRTVVGGARLVKNQWQAWTPPCAAVEGPAVLAASSGSDLAAVCDVGEWSTPHGEHLFVSHDGGSSFAEAAVAVPSGGISGLASPTAATVVAAGDSSLAASFDGGRTWSAVATGSNWSDLGFTTAAQGVVIRDGSLLMSRDGGHSWGVVAF